MRDAWVLGYDCSCLFALKARRILSARKIGIYHPNPLMRGVGVIIIFLALELNPVRKTTEGK